MPINMTSTEYFEDELITKVSEEPVDNIISRLTVIYSRKTVESIQFQKTIEMIDFWKALVDNN